MHATQASSSNDPTGSTVYSISSLYREYLQKVLTMTFQWENWLNVYYVILVGQNTPELHANKWSKVSSFLSQKGTPNIKVIFLFEVTFDIKHSHSGFEYDRSQICLKFLYVFCPTK